MNKHAPQTWAAYVVVGGAFLLVLDLFLHWQKASVGVGSVVSIHTASSAWAGWGFVVGILAIAVISATLTRRVAWTLGLAMAMLVATALAAFTGEANVSTQGVGVAVQTTTLWPAWVGLGLAAVTTAAALVPLLPALAAPPRGLKPHGTV
jgi:hypothetical protein